MPETLEKLPNETQERDYATCLQELEQGLPIFGRITGTTDGLQQVEKELPFNFRQPFNVVKAIFKLEPGLYSLHTGIDEDIVIGFRIDGANEQPETQTNEPATNTTAPENYYQQRALRLEGELHDADRKIRQLVDEIMGLKRQLSEDKTATLLTHQRELADQKESHRNEVDRMKELHRSELKDLEKEINELQQLKFRMEMEQRAGGRDAGSRMLDMLEENAPMFFTVISQLFAGQGKQLNTPTVTPDISEEQAKAMAESLKNQLQPTPGSLPQQPHSPSTDEASQPKGAGEETPRHLPSDDNAEAEPNELETQPTLNGIFRPPHNNGHNEPTISL